MVVLLEELLDLFLQIDHRKSLGGSTLLPFKNDGGYCGLEDL